MHDNHILLQAQMVSTLLKLETILRSGPTVWSQILVFFTELQLFNTLVYDAKEEDKFLDAIGLALKEPQGNPDQNDIENVVVAVAAWMKQTTSAHRTRLRTFLANAWPGLPRST